jgi:hypothetical protein
LRISEEAAEALCQSLRDLELKQRDKKRALGWLGRLRECGPGRKGGGEGGESSRDEEIEEQYKTWTRGHVLGSGGFGIVFRAQLWSSLEFVAVKEVNCKSMPEKMEKEIRVMMRVCVCVYVCVCVCVYRYVICYMDVCVYTQVYIYIYIHI